MTKKLKINKKYKLKNKKELCDRRERRKRHIVCSLIITSSIWLMQFSKCSHFETIFIPSVIHIEHLLCIKL